MKFVFVTGEVFAFGSNSHGQLGQLDLIPRGNPVRVALPVAASAVAAGGHHSVVLAVTGEIFTFGSYQKGQLGREAPRDFEGHSAGADLASLASHELWFAKPFSVPGLGEYAYSAFRLK